MNKKYIGGTFDDFLRNEKALVTTDRAARARAEAYAATQQRIIDFIYDFIEKHEIPPSVCLISKSLPLAKSRVHDYLAAGVEVGRLRKVGVGRHVAYLPAGVTVTVTR